MFFSLPLDVTLLNIDDGAFEVLASHGDTHLGGEDFDQRLMQYVAKKVQKQAGVDLSADPTGRALPKLRKEVERVKRALSSQPQARIEIDDIVPGYNLQETITRARFEEINHDLFQKTLKPVQEVLKRGNIDKSDVDHIVLVGGSTRIPKIQTLLSDFFDGKELSKGINPDEAVALGCAVHVGVLDGVDGATTVLNPMQAAILRAAAEQQQQQQQQGGQLMIDEDGFDDDDEFSEVVEFFRT